MSLLAFDPQPSGSPESASTNAESTNDDRLPSRDLLESVLNETLTGRSVGDSMSRTTLAALQEVAKRHRGQPLILEPVAVELVRALLRLKFPKQPVTSREWKFMSNRIAQTMLDDPVARERLRVFWSRLTEMER